jgi:hypothetical protein
MMAYGKWIVPVFLMLPMLGCASLTDFNYEQTQRSRARSAWRNHGVNCQPRAYAHDYESGWKDGFYDVATGGKGCPPVVAPCKYWKPAQITEDCDRARNAYYNGFQDGVACALQYPDTHYLKMWTSCECPGLQCSPQCGPACGCYGDEQTHSLLGGAGVSERDYAIRPLQEEVVFPAELPTELKAILPSEEVADEQVVGTGVEKKESITATTVEPPKSDLPGVPSKENSPTLKDKTIAVGSDYGVQEAAPIDFGPAMLESSSDKSAESATQAKPAANNKLAVPAMPVVTRSTDSSYGIRSAEPFDLGAAKPTAGKSSFDSAIKFNAVEQMIEDSTPPVSLCTAVE